MADKSKLFTGFIRSLMGKYPYKVMENGGMRSGIHITLPNNWMVSLFYGFGSYSTAARNRELDFENLPVLSPDELIIKDKLYNTPAGGWIAIAEDAEVAAWHIPTADASKELCGGWYTFEHGDQVDGYQTPDEIRAFIEMIAALPDAPYEPPKGDDDV